MPLKITCLPRPAVLAVAILCSMTTPVLAYDQLYVFGDSLSDTGNNGRFTYDSNKHLLYDEVLAQRIGAALVASDDGGNNYAAGGGVAVPALNPADNTQDQVQSYLGQVNGRADGDGLYIHWIGGNDLAAAALNPTTAPGVAYNSAAAAAAQVHSLLNAGAGTVIVPTVPNIGSTPQLMELIIQQALTPVQNAAVQAAYATLNSLATPDNASRTEAIHRALTAAAAQGSAIPQVQQAIAAQLIAAYDSLSAQAAQLTDFYNQSEDHLLAQGGGNIVRVDVNKLFGEAIANPAQFGFTNTAGMACPPGVSSAVCRSTMPGFDSSQAYLFADHFHPSPQAHLLIADYIQAVLDGPAQVVALNQATAAMARDSRATLDSRFQQLRSGENPQGSLGVFGGYAGQHYDYSSNLAAGDGNATTHNLTVGVDYQLTDGWLIGALISGSNDDQQPSSRYDYKARGLLFSAFTALDLFENGWVNADLHYATMNYDDIRRSMQLGALTRTETGSTDGKQWGARITAGYDFPVTSYLTTGPMAQFAWDYSNVSGYSEDGNDSTAMRFNDQTYHSQIGALGWRLDSKFGLFNPYAEVSYQHQFGDDVYRAGGGLKSTQTSFTRDSASQDKNWVDVTLGANMPLTDQVAAFATVSQTGGLSSGEQFMYNVGVSARF
ncbi:autotransporter outer membrane beta-barrel domain-containing protein [Serratia liquefaciens]|jgi:outer membrane lipase/esterase|uniref:autotransporter outer membrane beta-barrel domain-containing protein n=1 Tax=Serratia liquefaciens TaxID=614 RepID=UPI00102247AB|nr:autotransporter domain-containing protein [Serratia liquefaciens]MBF8107508.1 autotransporter domain-containing protein [Serratia liquefaciens]MBV0844238.1 autotransporter domain-containing protein [Serratia liquefaciens]RYM69017.1 autotransporter outer membrane beta-barrel domain-containing protein [Serratia liquefaciens]RYM77658.1 autotransporter outer membrane beta-barrel domain-containing protein [Serratia liquefaciens]CAB1206412.1 Lipase 1 [Serratia liquefaciens]